MPSRTYDAVVVGGGHNGLTCAAYLAATGWSVCVLERRGVVGGAAVTEEFHPGFRNSTASYTVSLLNPKVIRDLGLAAHGLAVVERPFANFLPLSARDGDYLKVGGGLEATQREVARHSRRDAEVLPAYYAMLDRVAAVLRDLLLATPPNVGGGIPALLDAWRVAKRFRRLDLAGQRDVLDLFTKSAGDVLDRWFESVPIKAAFGFDSIVGNFASPYTPGSALNCGVHISPNQVPCRIGSNVNPTRSPDGHADPTRQASIVAKMPMIMVPRMGTASDDAKSDDAEYRLRMLDKCEQCASSSLIRKFSHELHPLK